MACRVQDKPIDAVLELLSDEGMEDMCEAFELLLNEVAKIERSQYLSAAPYECSCERRGYANGYKPKAIKSRLGTLG